MPGFFSDVEMVRGYEKPHDGDAADYQEFAPFGFAYGADSGEAGVAPDARGNLLLPAPKPASPGKMLAVGFLLGVVAVRWLKLF